VDLNQDGRREILGYLRETGPDTDQVTPPFIVYAPSARAPYRVISLLPSSPYDDDQPAQP
jgi:hypothetical protein